VNLTSRFTSNTWDADVLGSEVCVNLISRFTEEMVSLAKDYCNDSDKAAAPEGGGSSIQHAMIPLHRPRIFLNVTYEMIINRLKVMPPILEIIES